MLVHGQNWAPVRRKEQDFPYMLPLFMLFQAQAPCVLAKPLNPPAAVSNSCGEPFRTGIPDAAAFSQHGGEPPDVREPLLQTARHRDSDDGLTTDAQKNERAVVEERGGAAALHAIIMFWPATKMSPLGLDPPRRPPTTRTRQCLAPLSYPERTPAW